MYFSIDKSFSHNEAVNKVHSRMRAIGRKNHHLTQREKSKKRSELWNRRNGEGGNGQKLGRKEENEVHWKRRLLRIAISRTSQTPFICAGIDSVPLLR